jgi:superfamily II DNA or RNA helicase
MYAVGMVLGLHDGSSDFFHWLHRHGVRRGTFGFEFRGGKEHLDKLNEALFPARGHRELPCDIPGFPKNQVSVMSIQTGRNSEIDKALENLNSIRKDDAPLPIVDQLRARQTVELMKIPAIAELAEDYKQAGNSIAVFLNFKESIHQLAVKLNTPCLLTGDQTDDERAWNIDLFQSNSEPVIICQIQCGGVGVSLHDVNNKPRVALISPSYSAVDLVQALGRINRASAVSPAVQKILVAAGTIEENIRNKLEKKIDTLNAILDSDLDFFS